MVTKRKAKITWGRLIESKPIYEDQIPIISEHPFFVDFMGWKEGSGYPCLDMKEVKLRIKQIYEENKDNYKIEVEEIL